MTTDPGNAFRAMSSFLRLHGVLTVAIGHELKKHRLNPNDYRLLMLAQVPRSRPLPLIEAARQLALNVTTTANVVARLESRGLMYRDVDPANRRATVVISTEAGAEVAHKASADLERLQFGWEGTTSDERAALAELLASMHLGVRT